MLPPTESPAPQQFPAVERVFEAFLRDHSTALSRWLQAGFAWLLLWGVLMLLWSVPVPPALGRPGAWAGFAMAVAALYYWRLSRPLGFAMALILVALGFATHALHLAFGPEILRGVALAMAALACTGVFVGHRVEGRSRSAFTPLAYLLIGPAWIPGAVLRRLRVPL